jgi:uncharacterized protein (DUF58 family)
MIRLSSLGLLLLSIFISFLIIGIATHDFVMLGIASSVGLALVMDVLSIRLRGRVMCECINCESKRMRMWVFEDKNLSIHIKCNAKVVNVDLPEWAEVIDSRFGNNEVFLNLVTHFDYFGVYKLFVNIYRLSPLKLFIIKDSVDTGSEIIVYPEALYWILVALHELGLAKGFGALEPRIPLALWSDVEEYISSREYAPGLSLKRIDWRATAKTGKLYVKLFSQGSEASYSIFFDGRCLGRYTCDRVASALLSTVLAVRKSGLTATLCEMDKGRCANYSNVDNLLLQALHTVLQLKVIDYNQLYEFVEPSTIKILTKILGEVRYEKQKMLTVPDSPAYIITTLLHDVDKIIEIVKEVIAKRSQCIVLTPARPWIDAESNIERNAIMRSHKNVVKALKAMGVDVIELDARSVVKGVAR